MDARKAGAYPRGHLSGVAFYYRLIALPTYISLSWKGLPGTNTLYLVRKSTKLRFQTSQTGGQLAPLVFPVYVVNRVKQERLAEDKHASLFPLSDDEKKV